MIIVAARPSVGKTTFALNLAKNIAVKENKAVLIFSLEMTALQLTHNLICMDAGIDAHMARGGKIPESQYQKLLCHAGKLTESGIFVDETSQMGIFELQSKARKMKLKNDIQLIIVDYLQLLDGEGENRQQEITRISRGLKAIAKELGIPVIALSQLNRASESRSDKRPRLSDLRESGAIEQDGDVVLLMHRDKVKDGGGCIVDLAIEKQRNGPTTLRRVSAFILQDAYINLDPSGERELLKFMP